jgi:hypothetical protein
LNERLWHLFGVCLSGPKCDCVTDGRSKVK